MRIITALLTFLTLFACTHAFAQHGTPTGHASFPQVVDGFVTAIEEVQVPVAEAMPDDKYSFAPTNGSFKGVRTFADMIKHVAASNYGMAAAILHEDPPIKLETEADIDAIKGKKEIVKFLKGSFDFLHKAALTINEQNAMELIESPDSPNKQLSRLEVAERAVSHSFNHYGQMIEYLRISGITPPSGHRATQ